MPSSAFAYYACFSMHTIHSECIVTVFWQRDGDFNKGNKMLHVCPHGHLHSVQQIPPGLRPLL